MPRARIGQLDRRVQLQAPTETRTASGGTSYPHTTYATVWARVEPDRDGMEVVEGAALIPRRMWRVTIRRRTGVHAKHRVLYGTLELNISSVGDDALRNEYMELVCTEDAP